MAVTRWELSREWTVYLSKARRNTAAILTRSWSGLFWRRGYGASLRSLCPPFCFVLPVTAGMLRTQLVLSSQKQGWWKGERHREEAATRRGKLKATPRLARGSPASQRSNPSSFRTKRAMPSATCIFPNSSSGVWQVCQHSTFLH